MKTLDSKQELVYKVPMKFDLLKDNDFQYADASAVSLKRGIERSSSPTAVEDFANEEEQIDVIIVLSIIKLPVEPDADEQLRFKDNFGHAKVATVSSMLDPDNCLDSLNIRAAQTQFAVEMVQHTQTTKLVSFQYHHEGYWLCLNRAFDARPLPASSSSVHANPSQ